LLLFIFHFTAAVTVALALPLLTSLATAFSVLVCSQNYHSPLRQHLVLFLCSTTHFCHCTWLIIISKSNSKVTAAVADTAQCLIANATAVLLAVTNWLIVVLYFLPE